MKTSQNKIQKVLLQLTHSKEAQYYLKHYSGNKQSQWIVIKVGGNIIKEQLQPLSDSLSLLYDLGITPVILHGAGTQIDEELQKNKMTTSKIDGIRVTSRDHMSAVETGVRKAHEQLLVALNSSGVPTESFFNSVFGCEHLDEDKFGQVGKVCSVSTEHIQSAQQQQKVPVISCLGHIGESQAVNINADIALRRLVWSLRPMKVIFITPTGGMLNESNEIISAIPLNQDYDHLMSQPWLHSGMKLKIEQIFKLLQPLPRHLSVSITSAQELSKELFTHRGHGTYVTMGETIHHYNKLPSFAKLKIISLLESTFNKKLKPNYLEELEILSIFLSQSSQALAIVTKGHNNKPYLNKFVVTQRAQGQGLGKMIWQKLIDHYPEIYWRSRPENAINNWYFKQSTTSLKKESWVTYTHGMNLQDSMECMNQAAHYQDSWQEQIL